jgi:hypothetical protein
MDIKNVFKISPTGFLDSTKTKEASILKPDSTSDRDGQGQSPYQKQKPLRELTEEELDSAVKKLKTVGPVIEHKWTIKLLKDQNNTPSIHILDALGSLIKIIGPAEILALIESPDPHKGQILKRSA